MKGNTNGAANGEMPPVGTRVGHGPHPDPPPNISGEGGVRCDFFEESRRKRRTRGVGARGATGRAKGICARTLRSNPTPSEALLWEWLRKKQVFGWKFRRQHPIAGFIVDFYCPSLKLAIEVDGAVHHAHTARDSRRDEALLASGVTVLRLTNDEVFRDPRNVAQRIVGHIAALSKPLRAATLPRNIRGRAGVGAIS